MDPHTLKIIGILLGLFGSLFLAYQLLGEALRPIVVALTAALLGVSLAVATFAFVDQQALTQAIATHPAHTGIGFYDAYSAWFASHLGAASESVTGYAVVTFLYGLFAGYAGLADVGEKDEKLRDATDEPSAEPPSHASPAQSDIQATSFAKIAPEEVGGRFPAWIVATGHLMVRVLTVLGIVAAVSIVLAFLAGTVYVVIKSWPETSYMYSHFTLTFVLQTVGFVVIIALLVPISRLASRLGGTQLGGIGVLFIVASYVIQLIQS